MMVYSVNNCCGYRCGFMSDYKGMSFLCIMKMKVDNSSMLMNDYFLICYMVGSDFDIRLLGYVIC